MNKKSALLLSLFLSVLALFSVPPHAFAIDSTGRWATVGSLATGRYDFGAALLQDGKVLVTGGYNNGILSSSEVYDPSMKTWSASGSLNQGRLLYAPPNLVTLTNGKVLVSTGENPLSVPLSSNELYDPTSGTWSFAAPVSIARYHAVLAPLPGGKALLATGENPDLGYFNTALVYDSASNTWSSTGSLSRARTLGEEFVVLADGRVMVAGGQSGSRIAENTAEVYDPSTGQWTISTMPYDMRVGALTLLQDGRVLMTGGYNGAVDVATTALYDPSTNTWASAASMATARDGHQAVLLSDGKVLVFGGRDIVDNNTTVYLTSTEIYDPSANTWTAGPSLPNVMNEGIAIKLQNGDYLATGGRDSNNTALSATYIFTTKQLTALDPATVWISKNLLDLLGKFDLKAEVYKDTTLVSSGEVDSVDPGLSTKSYSIPFSSFSAVDFPSGSALKIQVYARNACHGSILNLANVALHYNSTAHDSRFGATIATTDTTYHLLDGFLLGTSAGTTEKTVAVAPGAPCSPFKSFGTWTVTP